MKQLFSFPILPAIVVCFFCGCGSNGPSVSATDREAVYGRAGELFQKAILLKPREEVGSTNAAFTLAPLFLREIAIANSNTEPRVVYYEMGEVTINRRPHKQMTFLWADQSTNSGSMARTRWQGIRTTLDSRDRPVIWEVLNDSSGARVVFVTQSVEADSQKHFGVAPKGRRFAVETNPADAPETVVARVIEDGPVVMGPIAHLPAVGDDLITLICRCMTVQTAQVVATEYYELRPLSENVQTRDAFDFGAPVDQRLRLGTGF